MSASPITPKEKTPTLDLWSLATNGTQELLNSLENKIHPRKILSKESRSQGMAAHSFLNSLDKGHRRKSSQPIPRPLERAGRSAAFLGAALLSSISP